MQNMQNIWNFMTAIRSKKYVSAIVEMLPKWKYIERVAVKRCQNDR